MSPGPIPFDDLLAGAVAPGVYRWDSRDAVGHLRFRAGRAGWRLGSIDGWRRPGRQGVFVDLTKSLPLPEWFGHNYDALADSLADLVGPTVVVWDGWSALARSDRVALDTVLVIFAARASEPPPFLVLLRGAGPALDGVTDLRR